jgi:hypothetical protein
MREEIAVLRINREKEPDMPVLRVDPWDPEMGASLEPLDEAEEKIPSVDLKAEGVAWAPIAPPAPPSVPRCAFIDGVRRIDVRLFAEEGGVIAPGLAGSWAVGVAWACQPSEIEPIRQGRALVVGGGLTCPDLIARIGTQELRYIHSVVAGSGPLDAIQGLQNTMRREEAGLARDIFAAGQAELLVLDGPLTYFSARGAVVGLIKRQSRAYLPPDRTPILRRLRAGERTPLFGISERLDRYSWYTRLAVGRPIDGALAGIVRLEIAASVGLMAARQIADQVTAILPAFASEPWRDSCAPQNLYPVGCLEAVLRHRLGDPLLVRRAVESAIWEAYV